MESLGSESFTLVALVHFAQQQKTRDQKTREITKKKIKLLFVNFSFQKHHPTYIISPIPGISFNVCFGVG